MNRLSACPVRIAAAVVIALAWNVAAAAQAEPAADSAAPAPARDFTPLTNFVGQQIETNGVPGAALLILGSDGHIEYEKYFGTWSDSTTAPIASASKWWAAATIMTLVDDGLIALDDPLSKYLPEFRDAGKKSAITIRETLDFTSGLPDHVPPMDDPTIDMEQFSRYVVKSVDLLFDPGTKFYYGGAQMQLAARVAEVVTGKPYATLFHERIAAPLGLVDTKLANLRNRSPRDLVFDTKNPLVSGGLVTSVRDYVPFMRMLLGGGTYDGKEILSHRSVEQMLTDQTRDLPVYHTVQENNDWHYALGGWYFVHPKSGDVLVSSGGAFATNPWINVTDHYAVIFVTQARQGQLKTFIWRLTDLVTDVMNGETVDTSAYQPQQSARGQYSKSDIFSRLDRNGDGQVTRDEIPDRASRLKDAFDQLDRDKNGALTPDELSAR